MIWVCGGRGGGEGGRKKERKIEIESQIQSKRENTISQQRLQTHLFDSAQTRGSAQHLVQLLLAVDNDDLRLRVIHLVDDVQWCCRTVNSRRVGSDRGGSDVGDEPPAIARWSARACAGVLDEFH